MTVRPRILFEARHCLLCQWLVVLLIVVASGKAAANPTVIRSGPETGIRNVLFIVSDDLRASVLGCYDRSLDQFAERCKVGNTLPRRLIADDETDLRTLQTVFENGIRKLSDKPALIRTRSDDSGSSIRAFLSDQYAVINHVWLLETLRRIVPGGLVSHFTESDGCDTVHFNILIPDTIRAEKDSEYGGMLATGNSEVGSRRLHTLPSVFRAICMNGCIWDQTDGVAFVKRVHRGEINLTELAGLIEDNLTRQIPLLSTRIDSMLATRAISARASVVPVIGALLRSLNVSGITRTAADT